MQAQLEEERRQRQLEREQMEARMEARMAEQQRNMLQHMHACFEAQRLGQPMPPAPPGLFEPVVIPALTLVSPLGN